MGKKWLKLIQIVHKPVFETPLFPLQICTLTSAVTDRKAGSKRPLLLIFGVFKGSSVINGVRLWRAEWKTEWLWVGSNTWTLFWYERERKHRLWENLDSVWWWGWERKGNWKREAWVWFGEFLNEGLKMGGSDHSTALCVHVLSCVSMRRSR